jgi:hypothetical protein
MPLKSRRKKPPSMGRPPMESYIEVEQLTPKMKSFCQGVAQGLLVAQVAAELKIGVKLAQGWMDRAPAVKEYINQLKYEKDLKDQIPFWDEYEQMNREKIRVMHDFFVTKFRKEEVPWTIAVGLIKWTTMMAGLTCGVTHETFEVTEEQTTHSTVQHLMDKMKKDSMDPKKLPVELGGTKVRRSVKRTKKEE